MPIMNKSYEKLQTILDKAGALGASLTLFSWDQETLAPEKSIENTSKVIGILSGEYLLQKRMLLR